MKKSISTIVIASLIAQLFSVLSIFPGYAESMLLDENFNTASVGSSLPSGWKKLNEDGEGYKISIAERSKGDNCIKLESVKQGSKVVQAAYNFAPQSDSFIIEFDFMSDQQDNGTSRFYIGDTSGPSIKLSAAAPGFFTYNGTTHSNLSDVSGIVNERGKWYKFKIAIDVKNNLFDCYINDTLAAEGFEASPPKMNYSQVFLTLSQNAIKTNILYFDNIKIYQGTVKKAGSGSNSTVPNPFGTLPQTASNVSTNGQKRIIPAPSNAQHWTESDFRLNPIPLKNIKISDDKRYVVFEDGTPFFYASDVCWSALYQLTPEDMDIYLKDRADKEYTVIQANISGGDVKKLNRNGQSAFLPQKENEPIDNVNNRLDPTKFNEEFFKNVDLFVDKANALGLYVALSTCWGTNATSKYPIITKENARKYGELLGERYKNKYVMWIVAVDSNVIVDGVDYSETWNELGEGLKKGCEGKQLITYLPQGGSVAENFKGQDWLSFYMNQSGHSRFRPERNTLTLARDNYKFPITKPTIDGESCFEGIPDGLSNGGIRTNQTDVSEDAKITTFDSRTKWYWSVFAGSFGFASGSNGVYQVTRDGEPSTWTWDPDMVWTEALQRPSSFQVRYLRRLVESRPVLSRVPDQSILESEEGTFYDIMLASRARDKSYAFIYTTSGRSPSVKANIISGENMVAWWYNPRNGLSTIIGHFPTNQAYEFSAPSQGNDNDWVLVLDDVSKGYPAPGKYEGGKPGGVPLPGQSETKTNQPETIEKQDGPMKSVSKDLVIGQDVFLGDKYSLVVNEKEIALTMPILMINDNLMCPARQFFESIGASSFYEESTRSIIALRGKNYMVLGAGSNNALVNGENIHTNAEAYIINSNTYVPLRFSAETFGGKVVWDEENKAAKITIE